MIKEIMQNHLEERLRFYRKQFELKRGDQKEVRIKIETYQKTLKYLQELK